MSRAEKCSLTIYVGDLHTKQKSWRDNLPAESIHLQPELAAKLTALRRICETCANALLIVLFGDSLTVSSTDLTEPILFSF
jgi:hypothetical protein